MDDRDFFAGSSSSCWETLILRGDIKINPMLAQNYEVHGVDVSHYQGTIDWATLSQQNLDLR